MPSSKPPFYVIISRLRFWACNWVGNQFCSEWRSLRPGRIIIWKISYFYVDESKKKKPYTDSSPNEGFISAHSFRRISCQSPWRRHYGIAMTSSEAAGAWTVGVRHSPESRNYIWCQGVVYSLNTHPGDVLSTVNLTIYRLQKLQNRGNHWSH